MSAPRHSCPYCTCTFKASAFMENAYAALLNHVTQWHKDKLFSCGRRLVIANLDFWKKDGTCSYCGGISEAQFFTAVEQGAIVTPTDTNYKVYVADDELGQQKFYFPHLSPGGVNYFMKLYNDRQMNLDLPGYLYVLPYFAVRTDGERKRL